MTVKRNRRIILSIPAVAVILLLMTIFPLPVAEASYEGIQSFDWENANIEGFNRDLDYDPSNDPLVQAGYRERFDDDGFLQTPEPMPEDAVVQPYGWTPASSLSRDTRNDYELYFDGTYVDVYVDTSSSGGGDLSSGEKDLLDRIIDDFTNYSWVRVKDYFDPDDKVSHVDFLIHKIDGSSGVGGYYQPGTDEFHLDRDDFSWGGIIAAHEFQHYCHRQYDANENLWVDEGCADFGAYLVYGITSGISSHVYAYLNWAPRHSLVVDDATFYYDSTTSYYGSSFLFQLYMIEHYGGKNYTHGLVRSASNGRTGVNAGLASSGSSDDFNDAFSKWMVALSVNDNNAGDGTTYSYSQKTYPNGQLRLPLSKSHSGTPVSGSFTGESKLSSYGVTSIRFSSPPSAGETYRLELSYGAGNPIAAIYYETDPPRTVEHVDFGSSRSKDIDLEGWGTEYSSFRLITSSSSGSTLSYALDILDLVPPVSKISISPQLPNGENGWYTTSPLVTLSSESGAKIYYNLNGGTDQKYSQPFYVPDGTWNISYHAVDNHDNIEAHSFVEMKVDTSTPSSSMVVDPDMPEDSWYTEAPVITLNTAHPNSVILYKFGNDDYTSYEGPISPPEGRSTFFWKSMDQAGNEEVEMSRSFRLDTIPPVLEYELSPSIPDGKNGYYRTNPTLTITSDDAEALYYSFNGGELYLYSIPVTIPDGEYRIRMVPIDKASNQGEDLIVDVKVDTSTPSIEGNFPGWEYNPDNSSSWITVAPALEISGSESGMQINYSINGGPELLYDRAIQIDEGTTEIWIYGEDEAGNPADPISYFFKVDLRSPFVEAVISEEVVNGWYLSSSVDVNLELSEEDERASPVKIEYQWSGSEPVVYRNPISIPEGQNTLLYWATDAAGNRMETRSMDFRKDSVLPAIGMTLTGSESGVYDTGEEVKIDMSASEDESGIKFYAVDFTDSGEIQWTPEFSFTHVYTEPGTYQVKGYVKDTAGNEREKVIEIEIKSPVETKDKDSENDESDGSMAMILMILAFVIVLVVLIGVLAFVLIRRRSHVMINGNGKDNQLPSHGPHGGSLPGTIQNRDELPSYPVRSGSLSSYGGGTNLPPPPTPPGDISSDHYGN